MHMHDLFKVVLDGSWVSWNYLRVGLLFNTSLSSALHHFWHRFVLKTVEKETFLMPFIFLPASSFVLSSYTKASESQNVSSETFIISYTAFHSQVSIQFCTNKIIFHPILH